MITKDKIEFEGKMYDTVEISWYNRDFGYCTLLFATDLLYDDLFVDRESDEFKSADAERLFGMVEYFTRDAHNADTEVDFLNALCSENADYKEIFTRNVVRRCSICGKVMEKGYMDDWSDWYACSDECRDNYYSENGGVEAMKDDMDNDGCFYTEWETPFYEY